MISIGLIGFGYWGPNLARNFSTIPRVTLSWICDADPKRLARVKSLYPATKTTTNYKDILADKTVSGVVIATPVTTHFKLGKEAIGHKKHVLIEKPMTIRSREAKELTSIAKKAKRILMVDHTYVFTPAIDAIRTILQKGELGTLISIDSARTNLGIIQKDTNVIHDLAAHDFAIIDYLLGNLPVSVSATGASYKGLGQETSAYVTAKYPSGVFAHIHVSWLTPVKIRTLMLIGTKKMLLFDDNQASEKVKIYDHGVTIGQDPHNAYQRRIGYRVGTIVSPFIPIQEGLADMTKSFVDAIKTGKHPVTDGESGTRVVQILEAASKSLEHKGKSILL